MEACQSSDSPAAPASVEKDVGLEEAEVDSQLDALLECIKEEALSEQGKNDY